MSKLNLIRIIHNKIQTKEYNLALFFLVLNWFELAKPNTNLLFLYIRKKLDRWLDTPLPSNTLNVNFIDYKYIEIHRNQFNHFNFEKNIFNYNLKPLVKITDVGELVADLISSLPKRGALIDCYIESRKKLIDKRIEQEYNLLRAGNELPRWPYDYVTKYASKNYLNNIFIKNKTSLTFIYCVKNRSKRLPISVESLITSIRNNENFNVKYDIIIIEDESVGNFIGFDKKSNRYKDIRHIRVNTGIGWTRSGLLNIGIKESNSEWLAYVDVDFLFHKDYCKNLSEVLLKVNPLNTVLASNLIETEVHVKDDLIYSAGSPYSFMWISGSVNTKSMGGFDEGYTGHGFEDRDFELKHNRIFNSTVLDTMSINPSAYVMHLSHEVRTGSEKRNENKARYQTRAKLEPNQLNSFLEDSGKFPVVYDFNYASFKRSHLYSELSIRNLIILDFLFLPHNAYHAQTMLGLCEALRKQGFSAEICCISPPHPSEGSRDSLKGSQFLDIIQFLQETHVPKNIVVMNDWENIVVNPLINWANEVNINTISIVEGVNDFLDIDTNKNRKAYTRCQYVLLNGINDRRFFTGDQIFYVAGMQRLDKLFYKKLQNNRINNKKINDPKSLRVLLNCNFSYGVLAEHAANWVCQVKQACDAAGCNLIISRHLADKTDLGGLNASKNSFYDDLESCDIFISRFSGTILEALVLDKPVIYFNPDIEKIDKFMVPLGAYGFAKNQDELVKFIFQIAAGSINFNSSNFLLEHTGCKYNNQKDLDFSVGKTISILEEIALKSKDNNFDPGLLFNSKFNTTRENIISAFKKSDYYKEFIINKVRCTSFIIKSFGRRSCVDKLIASIRTRYLESPIYVLDDSKLDLKFQNESLNVFDLIPSGFDIGLAKGRNELVNAVKTDFITLLDDDFIFTKDTDIELALHLIESYNFDIVGGSVYDVGKNINLKDQPRSFYGTLNIEKDDKLIQSLEIKSGDYHFSIDGALRYDLCMNFFVCKASALLSNPWDDHFKLGEHLDFFLRAKKLNMKVGYLPSMQIQHDRSYLFSDDEYRSYRDRAQQFHLDFKKKWSLDLIVHDGKVIDG